MLRFSLIICTRNRPQMLARLLLAIGQLRYAAFELIVICDPEDPDTANCLARRGAGAKIGHCSAANLAKARNIGMSMAQGDIAAFIDDDAVPEADWLDRLADAYTAPEITAAGGFIRAANGVAFQNRFVLIDAFGADRHCKRLPQPLPAGWNLCLTGTNFSVRRAAALALGGFDENYNYFLEETDFLSRLRQAGGEIGITERAEVHHGYAASDTRKANGAPSSLRQVACSKAYFCHINRAPGISAAAIGRALKGFSRRKIRKLWSYLLRGRLSPGGFARLRKELRSGIRDGEMRAAAGRRLPASLLRNAAQFQPYLPHRSARRRLCVLMKTSPEDSPQWQMICELAETAYEVTVIYPGARVFHRVSFAQGVWRHRLALGWRGIFGSSFAVAAELRRIAARRQFEAIHVAGSDPALQRVAAASGLPRLPEQARTSLSDEKEAKRLFDFSLRL